MMRYFLKILLLPLYPLNYFFPKKKNVWVFGSGNGIHFNDNSRALFEHVSKNHPEIRAVWLTNNDKILKLIRNSGYEAYKFYSFLGIYLSIFAKFLLISHSFLDLNHTAYLFSKNSRIIQLWHGTPLKKLENSSWSFIKKILIQNLLHYLNRDCDIVISATKLNKEPYIKNFRVKPDQIKYLGQPRNDKLFHPIKKPNKKQIWYMPTFREYEKGPDFFSKYEFNQKILEQVLNENNAEFIINLHPVDQKRLINSRTPWLKTNNIIKLNQEEDIYKHLACVDILITDYSSVYFDFLLLNKPIIFAPFDLEKYIKQRDFYYPYEETTPGPKAYNWNDVVILISDLLNTKDLYSKQRDKICRAFNEYRDDKSSKRVSEFLLSILDT